MYVKTLYNIGPRVDKNFLALNPQTDRNKVQFPKYSPDIPDEALVDLSVCLRMKLDLASQQVKIKD
jgi:hypothetical protein